MAAPPFTLTPAIASLVAAVARLIGRLEGVRVEAPQPRLRKTNRIRTVHGSVAIEGNTLSLGQVTAVLEGRRVLGPIREVIEVTNANRAYELVPSLDPGSIRDLLRAHGVLTRGLLTDAGRFRKGNVGIFHGNRVAHVAPPASRVDGQVRALLSWFKREQRSPVMVKACVVHYELQFIHPFSDGNGRLGRLWQQVCLLAESPIFQFVPVESVIKAKQREYYAALSASDRLGDCAPFVEFSLTALRDALEELSGEIRPGRATAEDRLELARRHFGRRWFSRKEYLAIHQPLSTAAASRDLANGVEARLLQRRGDRALSRYRFI